MAYYRKSKKYHQGNSRSTKGRTYVTEGQKGQDMMETNPASKLDYKMTKDLPRAQSSILVKSDPFANPGIAADPYPYYNRANKVLNPRYSGNSNIQGSASAQVYNRPNSAFNSYFDLTYLTLKSNYRMLCIRNRTFTVQNTSVDVTNTQVITEMFKAFVEKMSEIEASSFTDFQAFDGAVVTSIPTGASVNATNAWSPYYGEYTDESGNTIKMYTGYAAVFLSLLSYQIYMQAFASTFCYVNKERSYRSHLATMAYNREKAFLESLWGKFNAKTWLSNWVALSTNLQGEYLDRDWISQLNQIFMLVSRKNNDILDPFMSIIGSVVLPETVRIYDSYQFRTVDSDVILDLGDIVFDSDNLKDTFRPTGPQLIMPWVSGTSDSPAASVIMDETEYTLEDMLFYVAKMMDPTTTLEWARIQYSKSIGQFSGFAISEPTQYANGITAMLLRINSKLAYVKNSFTNIKKIIGVMSRVGLNNWNTIELGVLSATNVEVCYNTTVRDLFANYLAGSDALIWNTQSMRWKGTTMFNRYFGIPEYDNVSGGSFLTFSMRMLIPDDTESAQTNYRLLPYMFEYPAQNARSNFSFDNICAATNRYGESVSLSYEKVNLSNYVVFTRLVPIPELNQGYMRMPTCSTMSISGTSTRGIASYTTISCMYHFIESLFHCGIVKYKVGDNAAVNDYVLNADLLMMTDFEIEDITNSMIAYGKSHGPIRSNISRESAIGFSVK